MISDRNHKELVQSLAVKAGYLHFAVLTVFALLFYRERVFYIDTGNQLFEMLNSENFHVFVGRYSMVFSQIIPVVAIKLGLSLRAIAILFSLSFILVYLVAYALCVNVFKNIPAGLCIAVSYMSASFTFFHAISETAQLLAFSSLLFAWLSYLKQNRLLHKWRMSDWLITVLFLSLNFFIHPAAIFTVTFVILYLFFDELRKFHWTVLFLSAFWISLFVIKMIFFSKGSHDESFFAELKNAPKVLSRLPHAFPVKWFLGHIISFYSLPAMMFITLLIHWINSRQIRWLITYLLFLAGFMLITIVVYNKGDGDHAMERSFLPLVCFIGLPFFKEVFIPTLQNHRITGYIALGFLGLCIAVGWMHIYRGSKVCSTRTELLVDMLYKTEGLPTSKFYVEAKKIDTEPLMVHYATSVETMLLSSMDGPQHTKTIFINHGELDTLNEYVEDYFFLYTPYWIYRVTKGLNPTFFRLKGNYVELDMSKTRRVVIDFSTQRLSRKKSKLVGSNGDMIDFGGTLRVDSLGQIQGVELTPERPYGLTYSPEISPGDSVYMEVQTDRPEDAVLTFTDDQIFFNQADTQPLGNGKYLKRISALVPRDFNVNKSKVYIWNKGTDAVLVDNLKMVITGR
ncbi:MAG TPA: hypothetical protein VFV37_02915 [Luteibaculaceae bacterium]|nr:hypothetical protein [Luteibaculaceae bacterium]